MTKRSRKPIARWPQLIDTPAQRELTQAMLAGDLPTCPPDLATSDEANDRAQVIDVCCPRCPLLEPCRAAGETEQAGVWGGIDRTTSTPVPRRRRKEVNR